MKRLHRKKLDPRCRDGIYLGTSLVGEEHFIGTLGGVHGTIPKPVLPEQQILFRTMNFLKAQNITRLRKFNNFITNSNSFPGIGKEQQWHCCNTLAEEDTIYYAHLAGTNAM